MHENPRTSSSKSLPTVLADLDTDKIPWHGECTSVDHLQLSDCDKSDRAMCAFLSGTSASDRHQATYVIVDLNIS